MICFKILRVWNCAIIGRQLWFLNFHPLNWWICRQWYRGGSELGFVYKNIWKKFCERKFYNHFLIIYSIACFINIRIKYHSLSILKLLDVVWWRVKGIKYVRPINFIHIFIFIKEDCSFYITWFIWQGLFKWENIVCHVYGS